MKKNKSAEKEVRSRAMKAGNFPKDTKVVDLDTAIDCVIQAKDEERSRIRKALDKILPGDISSKSKIIKTNQK